MEKGKRYFVVYMDSGKTRFCSGEILEEETHLIEINDKLDGPIWIGKSAIVKIREAGKEGNNNGSSQE